MPGIPLPPDRVLPAALGFLAWRSLQVAAAVLVIVERIARRPSDSKR